ncbi:Bromodomain-containing protein [Xylariaceae sp. FL0804]|nr:Bromodomain-containing protein [Xylariaceae sp. FL0804]
MATEEPQTLAREQTLPSPTPVEEMAVDDHTAKAVNGHIISDKDSKDATDTPIINGEPKSVDSVGDEPNEQNHKAFVTNHSLPDEALSKTGPDTALDGDVVMADTNGESPAGEASSAVKTVAEEQTTSPVAEGQPSSPVAEEQTTSPVAEPSPTKPEGKTEKVQDSGPSADSMDVDTFTDRPDVTSSAEHANGTQDTSVVSDAPIVPSPQNSSQQPADLSKLEIKGTQDEAPPSLPDAIMADPPASPAKVPRDREEDDIDERAVKRAKTDDPSDKVVDSLVVNNSLSSGPQTTSEARADTVPDDQLITAFQSKQIRTHLGGIKKTKAGANFRSSVEKLWPLLWDEYKMKVDQPVDISLFEARLRDGYYVNYGQFKTDIQRLHQNASSFNGPDHVITKAAATVTEQIFQRLPGHASMQEPAKPAKGKSQPTRHTEPRSSAQARRESQSRAQESVSNTKPKPKSDPAAPPTPIAASGPAFALPPSGVPQPRRASMLEDTERPKRQIVPTKRHDLDYPSRKKKLEPEQRFLAMALEKIKSQKHHSVNHWFSAPVDPVAMGLPQYFKIIKKPMDLKTMTEKLRDGQYKTVKDCEKDMRQIVMNTETFNGKDHEVSAAARDLEELFRVIVNGKDQWMEKNCRQETSSAAQGSAPSPERSAGESEEESDAEGGDEQNDDALRSLQLRLEEEQGKLNAMVSSKKPDLIMIEKIQQPIVNALQKALAEEKNKHHNEKKSKPKKSTGAKSKSKAVSGGPASGSSKKSASHQATSSKKSSGNSKKAAPKKRVIGPVEVAVIHDGINELDGSTLTKAVEIIKRDTGQNAHPNIRPAVEQRLQVSTPAAAETESKPKAAAGVPKAKKNKPMNKHEQERKIEQLRELKAQLQRHGSGSQEPIPAEAEDQPAAESSEEESDSEEE